MPQAITRTATRCHFCRAPLAAGEPVTWFQKSGHRGGPRGGGVPSRWVACCPGEFAGKCELDLRGADQAERDKQAADFADLIKSLVGAGDIEGAVAALRKATL